MNDAERLFDDWWRQNKPEGATEEDEKNYYDCWAWSWKCALGGVIT